MSDRPVADQGSGRHPREPPAEQEIDTFPGPGELGGGFDNVIPTAAFWAGPWPDLGLRRPPERPSAEAAAFREAMSRFASGVTVITTVDRCGQPWGFTASAFAALSASPPLVLVCLDKEARCHDVFMATELFAVSVLRPSHRDIARRFASKLDDKFAGGRFETHADGLPRLPDALASLTCETRERVGGGDHTILIGRVLDATAGDGEPAVFFRRRFRALARPDSGGPAAPP